MIFDGKMKANQKLDQTPSLSCFCLGVNFTCVLYLFSYQNNYRLSTLEPPRSSLSVNPIHFNFDVGHHYSHIYPPWDMMIYTKLQMSLRSTPSLTFFISPFFLYHKHWTWRITFSADVPPWMFFFENISWCLFYLLLMSNGGLTFYSTKCGSFLLSNTKNITHYKPYHPIIDTKENIWPFKLGILACRWVWWIASIFSFSSNRKSLHCNLETEWTRHS